MLYQAAQPCAKCGELVRVEPAQVTSFGEGTGKQVYCYKHEKTKKH